MASDYGFSKESRDFRSQLFGFPLRDVETGELLLEYAEKVFRNNEFGLLEDSANMREIRISSTFSTGWQMQLACE
jgi:hypothetical protein